MPRTEDRRAHPPRQAKSGSCGLLFHAWEPWMDRSIPPWPTWISAGRCCFTARTTIRRSPGSASAPGPVLSSRNKRPLRGSKDRQTRPASQRRCQVATRDDVPCPLAKCPGSPWERPPRPTVDQPAPGGGRVKTGRRCRWCRLFPAHLDDRPGRTPPWSTRISAGRSCFQATRADQASLSRPSDPVL